MDKLLLYYESSGKMTFDFITLRSKRGGNKNDSRKNGRIS